MIHLCCLLDDDADDEVLARPLPLLPLESNLADEEVDEKAATLQLLRATENIQATQPQRKSPKIKSPKPKKVTAGTTTTTLQPDCIIEVEASPEANERGHVVIAIENPNPGLDVHIVVRSVERCCCCCCCFCLLVPVRLKEYK